MIHLKHVFPMLLALALLTGCGSREKQPPAGAVPLTEEEIAQVNEAMNVRTGDGAAYCTEKSCFFTSYYDRVEELDFEEFLCYFPSSDDVGDTDAEEFAALAALPEFYWGNARLPSDLPVPTHRIPEEKVSAALAKWAGITLEDIADKSGTFYLEDYRAFYTFTSDFGPGVFNCAGGEVEGDSARLWSAAGNGSRDLLTLERRDGNWYIRSFQSVSLDEIPG